MQNKIMKTRGVTSLLLMILLLTGPATAVSMMAQGQQPATIEVSGQVTDEQGEPLIGVSVVVKNAARLTGTATDIDGRYRLAGVPGNGVLQFTSIGYIAQEINVNNRTTLNVVMRDDAILLGEMVVIGYGTTRKSDLTGSVASVKPETIADIPANSVEGLLQGRAAGVQVINSSQDPGAGATVRIRGNSSLRGSNAPLIVVDGFPWVTRAI